MKGKEVLSKLGVMKKPTSLTIEPQYQWETGVSAFLTADHCKYNESFNKKLHNLVATSTTGCLAAPLAISEALAGGWTDNVVAKVASVVDKTACAELWTAANCKGWCARIRAASDCNDKVQMHDITCINQDDMPKPIHCNKIIIVHCSVYWINQEQPFCSHWTPTPLHLAKCSP